MQGIEIEILSHFVLITTAWQTFPSQVFKGPEVDFS
jgi:hypothetical protein